MYGNLANTEMSKQGNFGQSILSKYEDKFYHCIEQDINIVSTLL